MRSHYMLPLSKNVKALDFIKKEKNWILRLLKFMMRMDLFITKIVKKVKEIHASFAFILHPAKVMAADIDKVLS